MAIIKHFAVRRAESILIEDHQALKSRATHPTLVDIRITYVQAFYLTFIELKAARWHVHFFLKKRTVWPLSRVSAREPAEHRIYKLATFTHLCQQAYNTTLSLSLVPEISLPAVAKSFPFQELLRDE